MHEQCYCSEGLPILQQGQKPRAWWRMTGSVRIIITEVWREWSTWTVLGQEDEGEVWGEQLGDGEAGGVAVDYYHDTWGLLELEEGSENFLILSSSLMVREMGGAWALSWAGGSRGWLRSSVAKDCVMFTEVEGQAERRINIYLKPGLRLLWRCLVLYDSMWMRAAMIWMMRSEDSTENVCFTWQNPNKRKTGVSSARKAAGTFHTFLSGFAGSVHVPCLLQWHHGCLSTMNT